MKAFPRLDILPAAQQQMWPRLAAVADQDFVLYGGTAVALFLGHRESVDFDFFTHRSFQPEDLIEKYAFLRGAEILQLQPNTLTVLARGDDQDTDWVKLSFFGSLNFGRIGEPQKTPDSVLEVASPDDLLAHKLRVLLQRVEPKDYLDIDALLQSGLDLSYGLGAARALFDAFAPQECLKALVYFEDECLRELPPELENRLIKAAKSVQVIPEQHIKSGTLSGRTR